jgi:unsaturated chondroitin disaccharide hydrolase
MDELTVQRKPALNAADSMCRNVRKNELIGPVLSPEDQRWLHETIAKVTEKMAWLSEKSAEKIPYRTYDGVHEDKRSGTYAYVDDGLQWWTNGFWGGMLWLMFHETGEEKYAAIARKSEVWLDECFVNFLGLHHDVGFMWLPTAVADYRLTGNADARRRGLHAANLLAGRFNPCGRFIRAWNSLAEGEDTRGWVIIDSMFNVPLLYWASEETGDPRFRQIAEMHADTVLEGFIRPDGSSEHIVEFDFEIGGKIRGYGGQGYADGSAWTRGQTWAFYGFFMSYAHTGKTAYLDVSRKVAHHFMSNIPESGLIPIDFRQPAEPALEDSIAAAVAACGFLELARCPDVDEAERNEFGAAALKLLKTLDKKRSHYGEDRDNILENCSGSYHNEKDRHIPMIYGDYFYMEALFKLKGNDLFFW